MSTKRKTKPASVSRSREIKKDDSLASLNKLADQAAISCFNSFMVDLKGCSSFSFHGEDITRARRIANSWAPQKYEPGLHSSEFDVPYMLSGFFDRFISCQEMAESSKLQAKAARKFLGTNLDGVAVDQYVLKHEVMAPLITRMQYHLNCFFHKEFNPLDLYHLTGHGPNRTTDLEFESSYLHLKNRSFAGSEACLQQLLHYLHWDDQLRDVILSHGDDAVRSMVNGWDLSGDQSHYKSPALVVNITETGFVPKKFDSLRTMCPEPTTTAFFAKMVALWITDRLREYCNIDLRTQPDVHKNLARLGSLYESLHIATVDWSEASDRIWLALVDVLMAEGYCPGWFSFMVNVCRCKSTSVNFKGTLGLEGDFATLSDLEVFLAEHTDSFWVDMHKDGKRYTVMCVVETTMISTMGNPLTFPLQTLIFWAFLEACTEVYASENDVVRDELMFCSSFGDDGIVDSRVIGTVKKYATWLNWKLNLDKSFYTGAFRESCGGDYYQGRMVRPFQMKRPPLDAKISDNENKRRFQAWLYINFNNLCLILDRCGRDPTALSSWILKYHAEAKLGKVCLVPPSYPDGSGIRIRQFSDEGNALLYTLADDQPSWTWLRRWDTGPCFCSLDSYVWPDYHNPSYNRDGSITFRCLTSLPRDLEITDLDIGHYYHQELKTLNSGDQGEMFSLSFFDMTSKSASRINKEGNVARKECRVRSTKSVVRFWL